MCLTNGMVRQLTLSVIETFFLEGMMRSNMLTIAALATMTTATLAAAQTGPGGPPFGRGGGPMGGRCAMTADSLTDTQKGQVHTLVEAFTQAHAPQLDSLRTIMEAARAARQAGKTPDEIRAIMQTGKPISDELAPARKEFHDSVEKVLTSAQIAAGCIPPAPGGPPGGRRGGPPPGPPISDR
jgi:Spy/CpxP family protein refolding chaperone